MKWGALGVFVVGIVVAGVALLNNQPVKDIDLFQGKLSFYSSDNPREIEDSQPQAQAAVEELETQAQVEAASSPDYSGADLTGTWWPAGGNGSVWYQIAQYGAEVVIQEVTPWGISAAGSGSIADGLLNLSFTSVDGNTGTGRLEVVGDSTLQGTLTNLSGQFPVLWQRG